jgi:iron(III) transport system permease protein
VFLVWRGISSGDGSILGNVVEAYSIRGTGDMVMNSLFFAVGTALLATFVGASLAFATVRTNAPFKAVLYAASLVPLVIPGILYTISWIFLLSDRIGWFNITLQAVGLDALVVDVFSLPGMIIVEGFHLSPIAFLLMFAALKATDPALEESALMSGASIPSIIRRVTVPLVRPALLASLLLMFVRGLESFETPALLGIPAGRWVFTSQIFRSLHTFPLRYDDAAVYSLTLILITVIGLFFVTRANRRGERFQTITGRGFRPRLLDLGRWRLPVGVAVTAYFLIAVVAPMAVLGYLSLLPFYIPPAEGFSSFSLENYATMFDIASVGRAIKNSILLSIGSATFLMLLMAVVSWITVRSKVKGRHLLDSITMYPLAFPGLVLGVSLIFVYLRAPIPIYGTLWILFIVYVTKYMPYAMRYASTSIMQISSQLEESARMSGASWWSTFRRVTLPLMAPGLVAGWAFVVVVSVRELSASILLYRQGTEVFSVVIWELWEAGQITQLAAVGVTLVLSLTLLVGVAYKVGANIGVRA